MMKYLIGLLCLFSVAQAQFAPTSAKTKFVNGIGIGSKDTSQFTAADTIALTIARDSVMYYRYRGFWRPIATGGNLSAYKLISDTLFANGYTTRARLKQGLDSLAATKGTVNSVGLTMPSAFNVANSPITSSGTIAVTAAGNATQYIRGDGALATLPTSGSGGGASVSYYLNGSVNQGTIGGVTYYEMNKTPIIGAGTDFSINADGYIASFLTDANDPALLKIPAGNWNFETYFSASSGGGSPTFYIELYKYNGTTFTLIASNSTSPKLISDGTNIEAYFSTLAVPETVLTLTDRLAVRIYVSHSGRTITLHTENGHLCQIITTFTTGLTALNGLTEQVQYFSTGTSGTDFNIASSVATHTFNLPTASATNRGALSSANWTTFNNKIGPSDTAAMLLPYLRKTDTATMLAPYYRTATATAALATKLNISDTAAMLAPFIQYSDTTGLFGNVVRTFGTQTVGGAKTFTDAIVGNSSISGVGIISTRSSGSQIPAFFPQMTTSALNDSSVVILGRSATSTYNIFDFTMQQRVANQSTGSLSVNLFDNGGKIRLQEWTRDGTTITRPLVINGNVTATNIIRSGGTSSQFLKADGSVDGTAYQAALTLTTTGTSGAATLVGATLNIPQYAAASGSPDYIQNGTSQQASSNFNISGNGTIGGNLAVTGTQTTTGNSRFNGLISQGQAASSIHNFIIGGNITGGTIAVGLQVGGTIQSDVTSQAWHFRAQSNTLAASFSLSNIYQFYATQGTFGTGSSVSNQVGFEVASSLIGATNNYGFRGQIASGTGRWNLYMNGTANNHLNGNLLLGTTTDNGARLQVAGSANFTGNVGIGTASPSATLEISRAVAGLGLSNVLASPALAITNPQNWGFAVGMVFRTPMTSGGAITNIGSIWSEWSSDNNAYLGFATNTSGTVSEKMRLNASGNLGLGVTPSAWNTAVKALQINGGSMYASSTYNFIGSNSVWETTGDKYINNGFATIYGQISGEHRWFTAPSGTAGNAISFTQAMTLDASGRLGIGVTSPTTFLDINSGTNPPIIKLTSSAVGQIPFSIRANIPGFSNSGFSIYDETAAASRLVISSTGNVGIGLNNPTSKLHSYSTAAYVETQGISSQSDSNIITLGAGSSGSAAFETNYMGVNESGLLSSKSMRFSIYGAGGSYFRWSNNGTPAMTLTSGGNLLVGTTSVGANGLLQINGSIGLSGNTQIRQASNGDGNTLQVFATQFVSGTSNSVSYSYTGGGLIASITAGDSALLFDSGRSTSTEGRVKVTNTTSGNTALTVEKNGVYTLFASTAGNVGIGTNAPQTGVILDIRGAGAVAGGSEGLRIGNVGDNSAYDNVKLWYTGFSGGAPRVYLTPRTTPGSGVINTYFHLQNTNGTSTASNNTMGLLVDGIVGIGTTAPATLLDVRSANISGASGATIRVGSQNHGGGGDEFANLEFYWGDPDSAEVKAKIYTKNVGNVGPGGGGAADLLFATRPAFGSLTERMRITSGGQVNINSTQTVFPFYVQAALANWATVIENSVSSSAGLLIRQTGGSAGFYYGAFDGGAYKFYINGSGVVNSTSTSITAISDITLKENIRDLETGLNEVMKLKPRRFDWKDETKLEKNVAGFIAQELQDVLPDLVYDYKYNDKETKKSIKMGDILPTLVKAIQELKQELDTLKNK